MDVAELMTSLRVIPHSKRGKMDGIKIPHGRLSKIKKGPDDLTQYGTRLDLVTCGDEHFTKLLFNTICNQAKLLERGEWELDQHVQGFVLVVVGGSSEACVAASIRGKETVRLNTQSIVLHCMQIEYELESSGIVKAEEGEMMIYAVMKSIFKLGFTHERSNEGIDCIIKLHSDDSDAFGGISMQAIYNLETSCIQRNKKFLGAIYLRGPSKSINQVTDLGNIFKTNIEIDRELCPTGRGFQFLVDLTSVYYTLEQDNTLPRFPRGHRAMSVVAVTYTLLNHDYLSMAAHGLTYSKLIAAMKSESYKKEVSLFSTREMASPISVTRNDMRYNLPGIILLVHHAFINRAATKKILLQKYKKPDNLVGLSYEIVRGAAVLAEELQPVPDPIALLAYLSCAISSSDDGASYCTAIVREQMMN